MSDKGKDSAGGDGLGSYSGPTAAGDDFDRALERAIEKTEMATLLPEKIRSKSLAAIYALFGAKNASEKSAVEASLVIYFAVHGTSPSTHWVSYPHQVEALGIEVPPHLVVAQIGQGNLKKFMGVYTTRAIKSYSGSVKFRKLMRERVQRAQLDESEGFLAIDYVGKDGSLDAATMRVRGQAKGHLLHLRGVNQGRAAEASRQGYEVAREVTATPRTNADPFA